MITNGRVAARHDELADALLTLPGGVVVRVPLPWHVEPDRGRTVVVASVSGLLDPGTLAVAMTLAARQTATVTVLEPYRGADDGSDDPSRGEAAQQEVLDMQLAPYVAAGAPPVIAEVATDGVLNALRRMHRSIGVLVITAQTDQAAHSLVSLALHELGVPVVIVPA
jgi:putative intracellular protease/amidase